MRVLVLHADGGRHPYVDAATDTGRSIESILETIAVDDGVAVDRHRADSHIASNP
mgnify:CR=1 FL=1